MSYNTATPYIASFVILRRGSEVAFVLRKNTGWMDGKHGLPSGKIEWHETAKHAAVREAREETGVTIDVADLMHVTTIHRHSEDSDWIDFYFEAGRWQGEPYNAEPEKSDELVWFDIENLPDSVVPAHVFALEQIRQQNKYAEFGWDMPKKT